MLHSLCESWFSPRRSVRVLLSGVVYCRQYGGGWQLSCKGDDAPELQGGQVPMIGRSGTNYRKDPTSCGRHVDDEQHLALERAQRHLLAIHQGRNVYVFGQVTVRVHSFNNVPYQPRNLESRCVLRAYPRQNRPKLKRTAPNRPKSPRTELGTSGTTVVRTWLGTLFKEPTRTD